MTRQIDALAEISALLRDRELSAVERIVAQLNAIGADVARLEEARAARGSDTSVDLARLTGIDMRWMAETELALRRLRQREAALRVEHELALGKARQAFGHADVTARLAAVRSPV